jgi:lipopolysaccharide transport protein LptA
LLYDAKRTAAGKRESVPVYAQSDSMLYINGDRILRYAGNVDIRQGTDRITSGTAIVYLDASNELKRTVAEEKVVITQPGRRATGEFAQYDAAEETIVLRGNPATIKDDERGSSEGREVTVRIKDNVVVGTGKKGEKGAGRLRSVYKLKDGKVN